MSLFDLTLLFTTPYNEKEIDVLINKTDNLKNHNKYPPYNIKIKNENIYILEIAVAGFIEEELSISLEDNYLIIKSFKISKNNKYYLHKGIATRNFEKTFKLAKNVEVNKCYLNKGLLIISLNIIEQNKIKPKEIKIEKY
tara:strand:- start:12181 stop:12600 length:420 start_codon:yes stop_codon:yes gene_type:complete